MTAGGTQGATEPLLMLQMQGISKRYGAVRANEVRAVVVSSVSNKTHHAPSRDFLVIGFHLPLKAVVN